jgi:hypothetical protein
MNKKLNDAVANLHLEPGDALVVDARVFTRPEDMHFSRAPRDVRIFAVVPNVGETVHDAFCTVHAEQIESLTKKKLFEMIRAFDSLGGHPAAIIDGIEKDFCQCAKYPCICGAEISPSCLAHVSPMTCAIHERCAVLRTMVKEPANATS